MREMLQRSLYNPFFSLTLRMVGFSALLRPLATQFAPPPHPSSELLTSYASTQLPFTHVNFSDPPHSSSLTPAPMDLRYPQLGYLVRLFAVIALMICFTAHHQVQSAPTPVTATPSMTKTTLPQNLLPTPTSSVSTTPTEVSVLPSSTSTAPGAPLPTTPEGVMLVLATTFGGCPPPLVPNTRNIVSLACQDACCLPCPASSVFYEPGIFSTLNDTTSYIRVASCAVTLVLAISYLVLPGRKQHPHLIILCMFITTALWEGMGVVWLARKRSLTCHSDVEESNMVNSTVCGVQGIVLVYLVGVLFVQGTTLIVNLHSLIVYRSSRVQRQVSRLIVLSFVLPLALVVAPAIKKKFGFSGYGSICFMVSDLVNPYFFYPVGAMMAFGVLVHLATVLYMIKTYVTSNHNWSGATTSNSQHSGGSHPHLSSSVSGSNSQVSRRQKGVQTARDISRLLKQQWRPGAFAICQLVIYLVYFAFYFIEIKKFGRIQPTSEWFQQWTLCLGQQAIQNILQLAISALSAGAPALTTSNLLEPTILSQLGEAAQRSCVPVAKPYVPQFWKLCLSDAAPAVFGICIFFIFGSKYELWQDWKRFIMETVLRRSSSNDNAEIFKMVNKSNSAAHAAKERGEREAKNEDDDHGFGEGRQSTRRKGSIPSVLPMTNVGATDNASPHHGISFYSRRLGSVDNATSSSRIDLATSGASIATTTGDGAHDDGYIPYHPPPSSILQASANDGAAQANSNTKEFKRTVSFKHMPTVFGGSLESSTSSSPIPSSFETSSVYGGPTARRTKKDVISRDQQSQHHHQQDKDDLNDLTFLSAYMHDDHQQLQSPGYQFYKDLEAIADSTSTLPSDASYLDPALNYAFSPPPTTIISSRPEDMRGQERLLLEQQEERARNVMDGTEPWPSWPSTTHTHTNSAPLPGIEPEPAIVVKGHRIRKQLSVILDHPTAAVASMTVPKDRHRLSTAADKQGKQHIVLDDQEEEDRILRRNRLRPSPLSAMTTIASRAPSSAPLPSISPPHSPPPIIPPRSRSRPRYHP